MATVDVVQGAALTVLTSTARIATPSVDTFRLVRGDAEGLILIIDVTADPALASVVFTIKGVDPLSSKTWTILASAAIAATGTTILRVHPSLTAVADLIAKDLVPNQWTVTAVHADADSITYSVAAQIL